jgi:hypothetical protein
MSTMTTESGMRTQSRIAVSSTSSSAIGTVRGGLATSYLGGGDRRRGGGVAWGGDEGREVVVGVGGWAVAEEARRRSL